MLGSLHGSNQYVPFSRQSVRSLCGRLAQESIEGDTSKTLALFAAMKEADPAFVLRLQVDEKKRVKTLFWCHGSSRFNYSCFGDAITFDTTYRTNLYNLPFGLFVGANHHFQTVIFGAVLLTEETTDAFHHQWVEEERVCMYTCKRAIGRFAKKIVFFVKCGSWEGRKQRKKYFLCGT